MDWAWLVLLWPLRMQAAQRMRSNLNQAEKFFRGARFRKRREALRAWEL